MTNIEINLSQEEIEQLEDARKKAKNVPNEEFPHLEQSEEPRKTVTIRNPLPQNENGKNPEIPKISQRIAQEVGVSPQTIGRKKNGAVPYGEIHHMEQSASIRIQPEEQPE